MLGSNSLQKPPFSFWQVAGLVVVGIVLIFLVFALFLVFSNGAGLSGTVLVIPVKGEISSDAPNFGGAFSTDELVEQLKNADDNPSISAIVLDIDSPGGTIVSTKQIVHQIRETKKPVVSYIGEVGASGAYYVAAATDYVICDEDSITGSIGVISLLPDLNGLMEKLGVQITILTEGKNKGIGNPFSKTTPEQKQLLQNLLSEAFSHFKRDVKTFRGEKLNTTRFEQIADGRILSGTQALDAGLIDELGPKQAAIIKAAKLAGIRGTPAIEKASKPRFSILDLLTQAGYSFGSGFKQSLATPISRNPILVLE